MNMTPTILFVTHDASCTGAPILLLRFLRWLHEHHQVQFQLLVGSEGELLPEFQQVCATHLFDPQRSVIGRILRRLKHPVPKSSSYLDALRNKLAAANVVLVYANTFVTGSMVEFLSFLGCPVICHVHELEQVIRMNTSQ